MPSINLDDLDAFIEKARELQKILRETPEVVEYMRLSQNKPTVVVPPLSNVLVQLSDVTKILKVSPSYVYKFVDSGRLAPVYTPGSNCMKFWLRDVMNVASREKTQLHDSVERTEGVS